MHHRTPIALLLAAACLVAGCGGSATGDDAVISHIGGVPPEALARPAQGRWSVLLFVGTDCPVSNQYAPEIRRICSEYGPTGVQCTLVYSERQVTDAQVRRHLADFGLGIPAVIDSDQSLAGRAGAGVTPQAVVYTSAGAIAYSGRIDNFHAALGRPRQAATEHDLRNALDDLVAGRAVRTPRTQAIGCYIE